MSRKSSPERLAKHAEWCRKRYREDPVHRAAHQALVRENRARYLHQLRSLLALAKEGGCYFCAEAEPCCMSFHHINPQAKAFGIGEIQTNTVSLARVVAELAKCVRVCENCHRKIHAGIISVSPETPRVVVPCPPPRSRAHRKLPSL